MSIDLILCMSCVGNHCFCSWVHEYNSQITSRRQLFEALWHCLPLMFFQPHLLLCSLSVGYRKIADKTEHSIVIILSILMIYKPLHWLLTTVDQEQTNKQTKPKEQKPQNKQKTSSSDKVESNTSIWIETHLFRTKIETIYILKNNNNKSSHTKEDYLLPPQPQGFDQVGLQYKAWILCCATFLK